MKHNKYPQDQKPPDALGATPIANPGKTPVDFAPSADEVARKAYFSYVNQGSRRGHDVQHWLEAEAELIAERDLTRVHGFHNKT
jgi:hypothetical protein